MLNMEFTLKYKRGLYLRLTDKRISNFLFITQGVGVAFVAIFLVAYLGGLPSTNVLHNMPVFRIPLQILGVALLILVLATVVIAAYKKRTQ